MNGPFGLLRTTAASSLLSPLWFKFMMGFSFLQAEAIKTSLFFKIQRIETLIQNGVWHDLLPFSDLLQALTCNRGKSPRLHRKLPSSCFAQENTLRTISSLMLRFSPMWLWAIFFFLLQFSSLVKGSSSLPLTSLLWWTLQVTAWVGRATPLFQVF